MSPAARLYLLALIVGILPIAAVAIVGCGGGATTTVTEVKTVTDESVTDESVTDETGEKADDEEVEIGTESTLELDAFQSPSGNIGCILIEGNARCDIDKHGWTPPPRPASCSDQVDYGQGLTVEREGEAGVVCAGDTAMNQKAPVLGYGEAAEGDGTVCASRKDGITCTNADGHGFFISVQGYKFF